MSYGFQNSDAVVPGAQGGKFGLNTGAFLSKFEYNPNGGKDNTPGECLDIHILVGEKEFRARVYPIQKIFNKDGVELTDATTEEYKKEYEKQMKLTNSYVSDFALAVVPEAVLIEALSVPITGFGHFIQIVERTVKSNPNWNKTPVDLFLQYQWTPTGDNTRTFLEVPKNLKHGKIVCPSLGEGMIEDRTATHLRYATAQGVEHPFKRGDWFLNSAFSNPVGVESTSAANAPFDTTGASAMNAGTTSGGSGW